MPEILPCRPAGLAQNQKIPWRLPACFGTRRGVVDGVFYVIVHKLLPLSKLFDRAYGPKLVNSTLELNSNFIIPSIPI